MSDSISTWLTDLLNNRSDKRWEPKLYAHSATADSVVEINGIAVHADDAIEPRRLEVRGEAFDEDGEVTGEELKATNTV